VWKHISAYGNGNLIIQIKETDEAIVCFKHTQYIELRCCKEAEFLMKEYFIGQKLGLHLKFK